MLVAVDIVLLIHIYVISLVLLQGKKGHPNIYQRHYTHCHVMGQFVVSTVNCLHHLVVHR